MLQVVVGTWTPNEADTAANLSPGFGATIMIINGGLECGANTNGASERVKFYEDFAGKLGVNIVGEKLTCSDSSAFSDTGSAGAVALFWNPDNDCSLVKWQTAFSALVEGDFNACKGIPCSGVPTTVGPIIITSPAATTTTTAATTTLANLCPFQQTEWTVWSECSTSLCGVAGTHTRRRDLVTGTGTTCTKALKFEAEICKTDCTTTTTEAATTTANLCPLQGSEWTAWTECTGGDPCGTGFSHRSQEVVTGPGTDCTKKTEFQPRLCTMECTTQSPTTQTSTTQAATTTTEPATTTANLCPLQGFEWTAWTECAGGLPCGTGFSHRSQEVVTGTGTDCTKKTDFEPKLCTMECTTQSPTTQAATTQAPTTQAPTTETATTTANLCPFVGSEWTTWTECAGGVPCGTGISQRSQEVVTGTGTDCTTKTEFEPKLCTMECTTQPPTTAAATTQASTTQAATTQAPTTEPATTQDPTTEAPTTEAPTTQAPTTQAPTTEPATTTANLCSFQGFDWSMWTECAGGPPCGTGISQRTRDVVTGTGSDCTKKTEFEPKLCTMECTTEAPTTAAATTEAATTTANPCPQWTAWTECAGGDPCGIGITSRTREAVTDTDTECTKTAGFEPKICDMDCP